MGVISIGLKVGDKVRYTGAGGWSCDDETDRKDYGDIGTVTKVHRPKKGPIITDFDEEIDTSRDGYAEVQWPKRKKIELIWPRYGEDGSIPKRWEKV